MMMTYHVVKDTYFGENGRSKNQETALKALQQLADAENSDSSKSAYLLAAIHLTDLLEKSEAEQKAADAEIDKIRAEIAKREVEARDADDAEAEDDAKDKQDNPFTDEGKARMEETELLNALFAHKPFPFLARPTPTQIEIIEEGLRLLKKAHEMRLEEATLLLGQLYASERECPIKVDGRVLGTMRYKSTTNRVYASNVLQTIGERNHIAAQMLLQFAENYLHLINNDQLAESHNYRRDIEIEKSEDGMICTPIDVEFEEFLGSIKKIAAKGLLDTEITERYFAGIVTFADRGALRAIRIMYLMHKDSNALDEIKSTWPSFTPDPAKAADYEKRMWEARRIGCENAIHWLENAKRLRCEHAPSDGEIELARRSLLLYATLRAQSMQPAAASQRLQEAINEKPVELPCGCYEGTPKKTSNFFGQPTSDNEGEDSPGRARIPDKDHEFDLRTALSEQGFISITGYNAVVLKNLVATFPSYKETFYQMMMADDRFNRFTGHNSEHLKVLQLAFPECAEELEKKFLAENYNEGRELARDTSHGPNEGCDVVRGIPPSGPNEDRDDARGVSSPRRP